MPTIQGSNAMNPILGTVEGGRFGHAVVNLGDINGDNCEGMAY